MSEWSGRGEKLVEMEKWREKEKVEVGGEA